jgi:hypothetical protein
VDWVDIVVNVGHADPKGLDCTSLLWNVCGQCSAERGKMRVSVRKVEGKWEAQIALPLPQ